MAIQCDEQTRSSIEGLSIPQVRSSLSMLRQKWKKHSPVTPLYPAFELPCNMTASAFSFNFIMSHHSKRQARKYD